MLCNDKYEAGKSKTAINVGFIQYQFYGLSSRFFFFIFCLSQFFWYFFLSLLCLRRENIQSESEQTASKKYIFRIKPSKNQKIIGILQLISFVSVIHSIHHRAYQIEIKHFFTSLSLSSLALSSQCFLSPFRRCRCIFALNVPKSNLDFNDFVHGRLQTNRTLTYACRPKERLLKI